jgi:hypothetical protein
MIGSSLRLSYVGLTEQDMLDILLHYQDTQGIYLNFALPANTLSGLTAADYTLTGFSWRYAAPPTILDLPCDRYTVDVELESVESQAALVSVGLRGRIGLGLAGGTAAAANGIDAEIGLALDAGGLGAAGITESIGLAFADNGAVGGNGSEGFSETISLELVAGSAAAANGFSETIAVGIDPGEAEVGATDPDFASVSLLLNMDGTNGSTTFTDSSSIGHTISVFGDAQVSTASPKFGTGALALDGTGDYLTAPSESSLGFGTSDFTIECWGYFNSFGAAQYIFSQREIGGYSMLILADGRLSCITPSLNSATENTATMTTSTWHHLAFVRNGNDINVYVDGVKSPTGSITGQSGPTGVSYIGQRGDGSFFLNGKIDDLRITKGVARYTATFTPPTAAFPTA